VSRTALGPTQPPIQWVAGALSLGVKRPGREADHSHPSSAEVKECVELNFHSPNTPSWRDAYLKHRDNFTTVSRPALGTALPTIQWVPGALSLGVKWEGREADLSPAYSAEFKNAWSYTSTPPIRHHGVVLC
jgi:hypothetical protein